MFFTIIPICQKNDENGNCSGEGIEFPTTNLYELESRVLTDHWSIPYKREESLGKCLLASTYLARLGKFTDSEHMSRFFIFYLIRDLILNLVLVIAYLYNLRTFTLFFAYPLWNKSFELNQLFSSSSNRV